jgi:hypothetical protein
MTQQMRTDWERLHAKYGSVINLEGMWELALQAPNELS